MPRSSLTEEQKQFIRDNYQTMDYCDLYKEVGMNSVNTLYWWCAQNGLRKRRKGRKRDQNLPKKIIQVGPPKSDVKRPAAVYDNPSWEQMIAKYENQYDGKA